MIRSLSARLRGFGRDEDGSAVIPVALWLPLFMAVMVSGVELGALSARNTALESAMDRTVRDVRLGTGTRYDHASLKAAICTRAGILPDCLETLQLEMIKLNARNWTNPPAEIACVDSAAEVAPVVRFEYGRDNELMLLRACYRFDPISPTTGLGSLMVLDAQGQSALVAQAVFVQEPI